MIKSKIDARERALELAISWGQVRDVRPRDIIECAEYFAEYIIGDAELPNVAVAPKGTSKPHICHARPEQSKNIETRNHDYKK